jgi:hypothetical protein
LKVRFYLPLVPCLKNNVHPVNSCLQYLLLRILVPIHLELALSSPSILLYHSLLHLRLSHILSHTVNSSFLRSSSSSSSFHIHVHHTSHMLFLSPLPMSIPAQTILFNFFRNWCFLLFSHSFLYPFIHPSIHPSIYGGWIKKGMSKFLSLSILHTSIATFSSPLHAIYSFLL